MEEQAYDIIRQGGSGEIVEKKSRFIATVAPANTEEEATAFIASMKKQYWDARHNCSAFVVGDGQCITRCNDYGEPSGTAGRPMLDVLLNENVRNVVVVVTRYFGGVLLGTGGLVRAYQKATQEGLAACERMRMEYGYPIRVTTDYNGLGKIQNLLRNRDIVPEDIVYAEQVEIQLFAPEKEKDSLVKQMTDATNGTVKIEVADGEMHGKNCG